MKIRLNENRNNYRSITTRVGSNNSTQGVTARSTSPLLEKLLTFLAYAIPLSFLLYVLYINFLPFGYNKTFTIDVGANDDTDSSKTFYLQPSKDLSEKKTTEDGTTYRELNGMANVVFKPGVVLKDAEITIEVEGDGVEIIPPYIDFKPEDYDWDYSWDFTKPKEENPFKAEISDVVREELLADANSLQSDIDKKELEERTKNLVSAVINNTLLSEDEKKVKIEALEMEATIQLLALTTKLENEAKIIGPRRNQSIQEKTLTQQTVAERLGLTPEQYLEESTTLIGDAFPFEGCMYFDGKSKLELPHTADKFEDGPFTIYVEWTPEDFTSDYQQIIGHYNWELFQNQDSIEFKVGRMNDETGMTYSIKHPLDSTFPIKSHTLLATYSPTKNANYLNLFIDNIFVEQLYINADTIWADYGNKLLTIGKSYHGVASSFKGRILSAKITKNTIPITTKKTTNKIQSNHKVTTPIISHTNSILNNLSIYVSPK